MPRQAVEKIVTIGGQYHAYGTTNEGITVDDYFLLWESADGFTVTGRHVAGLVYQEPYTLEGERAGNHVSFTQKYCADDTTTKWMFKIGDYGNMRGVWEGDCSGEFEIEKVPDDDPRHLAWAAVKIQTIMRGLKTRYPMGVAAGKGGKKHYTHADAYICLARAAVTPKCVIQSSTTILRVHMPGDLVIVNQLVETERTTRAHTGEGWISLTSGNGLKLFQAASAISPERCAHLARIQMVSRDVSESVSGGSSSAANAALRAELVAATKELERLRARYTTVGETNTKQDMQIIELSTTLEKARDANAEVQRQRDKVIQDAKDEMERQGHLKYSNIEVEHRDNKIELRKLDKANQTLTVQNVKQREEIARLEAQLETLPGTERQLRETHYDRDKLEADLVRTTSNLKARVEECATKDAEIERLELVLVTKQEMIEVQKAEAQGAQDVHALEVQRFETRLLVMNTHVLSAEEKLVRVTAQEKEYRTAKLDASQLERLYEASLLKQDELHKTEDRLRDLLSNAAEELEQLKFELKAMKERELRMKTKEEQRQARSLEVKALTSSVSLRGEQLQHMGLALLELYGADVTTLDRAATRIQKHSRGQQARLESWSRYRAATVVQAHARRILSGRPRYNRVLSESQDLCLSQIQATMVSSENAMAVVRGFDVDGSGTLEAAEITAALTQLGVKATAADLERVVRFVDTEGGDGRIQFDRFFDRVYIGSLDASRKRLEARNCAALFLVPAHAGKTYSAKAFAKFIRETARVPKKIVSDSELLELYWFADRRRHNKVDGADLGAYIRDGTPAKKRREPAAAQEGPPPPLWRSTASLAQYSVLDNAFGYMARCLRRKKLEPAQACARWDVDQSRSLSFSEFDAAMAEVDVRLSPGEKRLIINCMDLDADGHISIDAFVSNLMLHSGGKAAKGSGGRKKGTERLVDTLSSPQTVRLMAKLNGGSGGSGGGAGGADLSLFL